MRKKVAVGISGGVDSSVAAYLLKREGYDVLGMFMINWHDKTGTLAGDCPWNDDLIFAELVARKLDIPLVTVDFSEEYRKRVVDYMFREYQSGRTPNPDVLCNREVKFDLFIKAALENGADYIATGHYCRKEQIKAGNKHINRLLRGIDSNKDQSYFLCQLSQEQLDMALFPVGNLWKQEVRDIAREQGLATAERKDSQGICFVGKVDLPSFLMQKLKSKEGAIIEIPDYLPVYRDYAKIHREWISVTTQNPASHAQDLVSVLTTDFKYHVTDGITAGKHDGAHFYTIGQRKGLNIGGKAEPMFVIGTDTNRNNLYVGMGHNHPGLNRWGLFVPAADIHWIRKDLSMLAGESRKYQVRVRYRQPLQDAVLYMNEEGLHILFDKKQRGITSGQFAAWYDGEELIGSGVIG
ncbi:MAG TPA: tRNA 2-thiouridine(34) synthase MnmA [Bacteroidales bacterium]|nr:tRNA 2-thiouridine(34) synthase MnmA [Bacteroidales bacterium]